MTDWPKFIAEKSKNGTPARILVCGGRAYADKAKVFATLDRLAGVDINNQLGHNLVIIQGGQRGADALASDWAVCNWKQEEVFRAEWLQYGLSAGPIRNEKMLVEGKPDLVVAFPGNSGTAHMTRIALEAGVPVLRVT